MVTDTDNDVLYGLNDLPKFSPGTDRLMFEWITLFNFDVNTKQTFKELIANPYSLRYYIRQGFYSSSRKSLIFLVEKVTAHFYDYHIPSKTVTQMVRLPTI